MDQEIYNDNVIICFEFYNDFFLSLKNGSTIYSLLF